MRAPACYNKAMRADQDGLRFFELAGAPVIFLSLNSCIRYHQGQWSIAGRDVAEQVLTDGVEIGREEFLDEYPEAAALLPPGM